MLQPQPCRVKHEAGNVAVGGPVPQNDDVTEFTGERVIPGKVDDDLWAEHMARYAFAARFSAGKRVLDLGCGTGYGTAELAKSAQGATGVDLALEAIGYASEHYAGVTFLQSPAQSLPFETASFDLVTCFELIEHLEDWRAMLHEVRRVLALAGLMIISTPNKVYYAEARGAAGPNPFHRHEFEYREYQAALQEVFPHVRILLQNRLESFGFYESGCQGAAEGSIVRAGNAVEAANFFVALCSAEALPEAIPFIYVPQAANLLGERERHIRKLQDELGRVREWLEKTTRDRDAILSKHAELNEHLRAKNEWAQQLQTTLDASQNRVVDLQNWVAARERDIAVEKQEAIAMIGRLEQTVVERTLWARKSDEQVRILTEEVSARRVQIDEMTAQLRMVRESRWVRAGNAVGLGPKVSI